MTRVLITGGTGMVGRNLLEHPAARDHECIAPDRSKLDLTDARACLAFLQQVKPDLIIHTAGKVGGIQANMADPVGFLVANLTCGCNIVTAARQAGVPALLNLGSSCMYPRNAPNPLAEESLLTGPLEPTNEGYALAKVAVARLCALISQQDGLTYRTVIPCNIFGRHDTFDPTRSHLVPGIIHKTHCALKGKQSRIEIWGDGHARREFMYSVDLADGIWHLVRRLHAMPALVNLGVGEDHSILEYYKAAADVIGWQGTYLFNPDKPAGMPQKLVSIEQQTQLGWAPRTSLQDGIGMAYEYYLSRPETR